MIRLRAPDDLPEPRLSFEERLQRSEDFAAAVMREEISANEVRAAEAAFLLDHARRLRQALAGGDGLDIAEHAAAVAHLELRLRIWEHEPRTRRGHKAERDSTVAGGESGRVRAAAAHERAAAILSRAQQCLVACDKCTHRGRLVTTKIADVIKHLRRHHAGLLLFPVSGEPDAPGKPASDRALYSYLRGIF